MSTKRAPRFRRSHAYLVKAAETRPQRVGPAEGPPRAPATPTSSDLALAREMRRAPEPGAQDEREDERAAAEREALNADC